MKTVAKQRDNSIKEMERAATYARFDSLKEKKKYERELNQRRNIRALILSAQRVG